MIPLTFRQLEVFVRVVEAGSFRACAEQLSISQVAVGEHVRALEKQLNCTLFERQRGSAAVLTHMGEKVFARSRVILAEAVDLLAIFDRAPQDRMRPRIRIGAHGFIAESLAKRLAGFLRGHPEVDVELERRSYAEVISGLQQNEIEIGYFLARGPVTEVESFVAWEEPLAFYVGAHHPLAARAHVEASDLSGTPFVYLPSRSHLRGEVNAILGELGIRDCPAALTTDNPQLILANLSGGESFGCLFADWIDLVTNEAGVARLAFSKSVPPMQIRFAVRSAYRTDRTVGLLVDALNRHSGKAELTAS